MGLVSGLTLSPSARARAERRSLLFCPVFSYTTKPYSSEVRFIGTVPTPWPSWSIVASTSLLTSPTGPARLRALLASLQERVRAFDSEEARKQDNVDFIMREFGYPEEDVRGWLQTVRYVQTLEGCDEEMIRKMLESVPYPPNPPATFSPDSSDFLAARSRRPRSSKSRRRDGSSRTRSLLLLIDDCPVESFDALKASGALYFNAAVGASHFPMPRSAALKGSYLAMIRVRICKRASHAEDDTLTPTFALFDRPSHQSSA